MSAQPQRKEDLENRIISLRDVISNKDSLSFEDIIRTIGKYDQQVQDRLTQLEQENRGLQEDLVLAEKHLEFANKELDKLRPLTIRDAMTGAYNHAYFEDQLEKEIERSNRHNVPVSLVMMDIDYFKKFNDSYGHQAGDFVLKQLSNLGESHFRHEDYFARYGGEEFAVILPDTREQDAFVAAEHFRNLVKETDFKYKGQDLNVTLSVGVAQHMSESADRLVTKADDLLYLAKELGRDCTLSYSSAENEEYLKEFISKR